MVIMLGKQFNSNNINISYKSFFFCTFLHSSVSSCHGRRVAVWKMVWHLSRRASACITRVCVRERYVCIAPIVVNSAVDPKWKVTHDCISSRRCHRISNGDQVPIVDTDERKHVLIISYDIISEMNWIQSERQKKSVIKTNTHTGRVYVFSLHSLHVSLCV